MDLMLYLILVTIEVRLLKLMKQMFMKTKDRIIYNLCLKIIDK